MGTPMVVPQMSLTCTTTIYNQWEPDGDSAPPLKINQSCTDLPLEVHGS